MNRKEAYRFGEDDLRDVFRPGTADLIAFVGLVAIVFFAGIVTGFFMGKFL